MSAASLFGRVRAAFRRPASTWELSDELALPFAAELEEENVATFNKLTVVVTDDDDDDEELIDAAGPLGAEDEPCRRCASRRERAKRAKEMKRLALAALLYLLFMTAEVVEVVSALVSVLLVYALTAALLYEATQRALGRRDFLIDGDAMLITAAAGVAVNLLMGYLLKQNGRHHHHHGHAHHASDSLAVRAAFVHALGDLLQSLGVLLAAYVVRFKPQFKLADPICTYVFSVLVLFTTLRVLRDALIIVLEAAPRHVDTKRLREELTELTHVETVEELNVWALSGELTAAVAHLRLAPSGVHLWEDVQASARTLLMRRYHISRCTVQLTSRAPPRDCAPCLRDANP